MTTTPLPSDLFAPSPLPADQRFWRSVGLDPVSHETGFSTILPSCVIALPAATSEARDLRIAFTKEMGVPASIILRGEDHDTLLYRVTDDAAVDRLKASAPIGLEIRLPGDSIMLPPRGENSRSVLNVGHVADLSLLPVPDSIDPISPPSVVRVTPLSQFSLKGSAAAFEAEVSENTALLGEVCLSGQSTVWYAAPGTGKTLVALSLTHDAVRAQRIAAENIYYINADDNHAGLTTKLRLMEDLGAHMLVPGYKGFENRDLISLLATAVERDQARGVFVIVDTLKKFASLMDKKDSSAFADACRRFVMGGGTVLGLAHTAKNPNANGTLRYAGTTDVLEDFDAAYLIAPIERSADIGEKVVEFTAIKRRGNSADSAAYAYAAEKDISYVERLLSVRLLDLENLDTFKRIATERSDAEVITVIKAKIEEGINQKVALATAAAELAGVSKREAGRIIERYTGNEIGTHHWRMSIQARGAKVFEILPSNPE